MIDALTDPLVRAGLSFGCQTVAAGGLAIALASVPVWLWRHRNGDQR